jgi:hypothetical protein
VAAEDIALQGQHIGIPLPMKVRRNDKLFIITSLPNPLDASEAKA